MRTHCSLQLSQRTVLAFSSIQYEQVTTRPETSP